MSLASYAEVRPWAQAIQERVLDGTMPPWPAEPGHEPLRGTQPLTAREIDILCDWAAGGAPAGDSAAGTAAARGAEIRASPQGGLEAHSVEVDGGGGVVPLAEDLHLAGWWIEPREGPCPRAAVLRVEPAAGAAAPTATHLGSWIAGQGPFRLPDGAAFTLPAGSTLRLEVLPGKAPPGASRGGAGKVTLRLAVLERPPRNRAHATVIAGRGAVDLPAAARVAAVLPLGEGGPARLVLHGGDPARSRVLLEVSRASAVWPVTYSFADPPAAGPGGRIAWEPLGAAAPRIVVIFVGP
jgi:hypothetical protein